MKTPSRRKKALFYFIGITFTLIVVLLLGELMARAAVSFREKKYPAVTTTGDPETGAKAVENYHWNGTVKDSAGIEYALNFSTDENGFRKFGDVNTAKKKVFFIGDSFTHAIEVSNDSTYFCRLGNMLDIEVFAYGCRGFSTLQEYMVLEKWLDKINPDAVVLQFCSNDFVNNHLDLERKSLLNNNRRRRPYLMENDSIVFAVPAKIGWDWLNERSILFQFVFTKIERTMDGRKPREESSEYKMEHLQLADKSYAESVQRTERLFEMFKTKLLPQRKFLVFTTDHEQPFFDSVSGICQKLEIPFAGDVQEKLNVYSALGQTTKSLDGAHWNNAGHAAVAKVLSPVLGGLLENNQMQE